MPPHRPAGKDANLHTSCNEAARLLSVSVRSVASASAVLDKADPAVVKAVEQGRVTVSCASEISKLNLDSEDTSELMTLPKATFRATSSASRRRPSGRRPSSA
jgi:hypothetical protein